MPILTGGKVIEGSRPEIRGATAIPTPGHGGYYNSPGVPAAGFLNGVAQPGSLCVNVATGVLYMNTGTLAATVWTSQGSLI